MLLKRSHPPLLDIWKICRFNLVFVFGKNKMWFFLLEKKFYGFFSWNFQNMFFSLKKIMWFLFFGKKITSIWFFHLELSNNIQKITLFNRPFNQFANHDENYKLIIIDAFYKQNRNQYV
jgi:hypothetical protein